LYIARLLEDVDQAVMKKDEELQERFYKVNKITKLFNMRIYTKKRKRLTVFVLNNSIRANIIVRGQIID